MCALLVAGDDFFFSINHAHELVSDSIYFHVEYIIVRCANLPHAFMYYDDSPYYVRK